jgi:hypothetical protein
MSTPTPPSAGAYPAYGQAPDRSWIAGQVMVTRIQGGCTYIRYDPSATSPQVHPGGDGWAAAQSAGLVPDGAFIVAFGHIAGPNEPHEMCPGDAYIVDRVLPNADAPRPATPTPGGLLVPTITPLPNGVTVITGTSSGGPILGPPLVPPGGATPPAPTPSLPLTPSAGGVVTVTIADLGRTVEMGVGNTLQLQLTTGYDWTVTVADPAILVQTAAGASSGEATYQAKQPGTTTLTATGDPPCRKATPPCDAPSLGFQLTVIVH